MEGVLHLEGSVKATKLKLTWLPDIPDLVPLRLVDFDHLITKKKIEDEDNIEDLVNPNSVGAQALSLIPCSAHFARGGIWRAALACLSEPLELWLLHLADSQCMVGGFAGR
jgi:hypothetical protein